MKRKIIITESQYNKLQEFLFETTDVNHTLDFVKVGDVLKFKTSAGSDYTINVKHVDQKGNEILGDNHGKKIRLSFDSYDEQNKKLNYKQLDTNIQKYLDKTADVNELDIERNGQVLSIPDVGGNKQPEPGQVEPTQGQEEPVPVGQEDEIAKTVEMDPNVTATPKTPEEVENIKKQRMYGKKALKAITSDPKLQAAFYRQPSFWKLFMADLQGKTAPGKGIQPTLALINGYLDKKNKENNPELQPFVNSEIADFMLPESVDFTIKSKTLGNKDNTYTIPEKVTLKATNGLGNWYDETTNTYRNSAMLSYKNTAKSGSIVGTQFDIMVKPPSISKDTFKCDIIVNSNIVAKDVVITFLPSSGYNKKTINK